MMRLLPSPPIRIIACMAAADEEVDRAVAALRNARRINVIGTSGTGKSTFSRELALVRDLPCIEIDRLFWLPDWQEPADPDFFVRLDGALAGERWILDGNYNRTQPVKWRRVECVVWLDYPFARTLFQAIRRAFRRSLSGEELWPGTGNRESFRKSFLSRDSIILWTLKSYRSNRAKYLNLMRGSDRAFGFVRIGSPAQAAEVLRQLTGKAQEELGH